MKRFWTVVFSLVIVFSMLVMPGINVDAHKVPDWQRVNAAPNERMAANISAMVEFKGQIYTGTSATYYFANRYPASDVQAAVYRSKDGKKWEKVSKDGFGDTSNNKHIWALTVFNNQLYAGTGGFDNLTPSGDVIRLHAQIWRTHDGTTWEAVEQNGFGDIDNLLVKELFVHDGMIYSFMVHWIWGLQIYRSPNGNPGTWTKVTTQFDNPTALYLADGVTNFKGMLFVSVEGWGNRTGVFKSRDGLDWTAANQENFGLPEDIPGAGGLGVYKGQLYVGIGSTSGAQIWRTGDGQNWTRVMQGGFGDVNNWNIETLIPFKGDLYAVTQNGFLADGSHGAGSTGAEVWRTHNGIDWEQVNQDGFNGICTADGSYCNDGGMYGAGAVVFKDALYLGTSNPSGGEIYRMNP